MIDECRPVTTLSGQVNETSYILLMYLIFFYVPRNYHPLFTPVHFYAVLFSIFGYIAGYKVSREMGG